MVKIMVGYLRILQRVLHEYRLDFAQLGLSTQDAMCFAAYLTDEQHSSCSLEQYLAWLTALQSRLTRPVAIVMAEQMLLQDIGLVGYLLSTSVDLEQIVQLFKQYYPLLYNMTNAASLHIEQSEGVLRVSWQTVDTDWQLFDELNVCLLYRATLLLIQPKHVKPLVVDMGRVASQTAEVFERFFGCRVTPSSHYFGLAFDEQILSTKSIAADAMLHQVLSQQAAQSVQHFRAHHADATSSTSEQEQPYSHSDYQVDIATQLKHKITALLKQQELLLQSSTVSLQQEIATQLHCSVRTLQRQLKRHGLDFQHIIDDFRYQLACELLHQTMPLHQVAAQLGYADQSAFGRAFKRWSGQTPNQYRQQRYAQRQS